MKKKSVKSNAKIGNVLKKKAKDMLDIDKKVPQQSTIKRVMKATDQESDFFGKK